MRLIFCMQINIKIFRESIYVLLIYIVVIYVDVICSTAAKSNIYSFSLLFQQTNAYQYCKKALLLFQSFVALYSMAILRSSHRESVKQVFLEILQN